MDEHSERKSAALAKVLRNFKIKSATARKADNKELIAEMEQKRDSDAKQVKADYAKINTEEKNKIKERFNEQAKQVNIDTKALVEVLMQNRHKTSSPTLGKNSFGSPDRISKKQKLSLDLHLPLSDNEDEPEQKIEKLIAENTTQPEEIGEIDV